MTMRCASRGTADFRARSRAWREPRNGRHCAAYCRTCAGLRVLDLGCGFGWFCRWAREQGASALLGIDVSEKLLTRASEATRNPAISYARADMERLEVPPDSFRLRIQLIGAPLHREARPADGDRVPLARSGREFSVLGGAPELYGASRTGVVGRFPRVARLGPSIAIWTKALVLQIGWPKASSSNPARAAPRPAPPQG